MCILYTLNSKKTQKADLKTQMASLKTQSVEAVEQKEVRNSLHFTTQ